jgi:hypothetical protein
MILKNAVSFLCLTNFGLISINSTHFNSNYLLVSRERQGEGGSRVLCGLCAGNARKEGEIWRGCATSSANL